MSTQRTSDDIVLVPRTLGSLRSLSLLYGDPSQLTAVVLFRCLYLWAIGVTVTKQAGWWNVGNRHPLGALGSDWQCGYVKTPFTGLQFADTLRSCVGSRVPAGSGLHGFFAQKLLFTWFLLFSSLVSYTLLTTSLRNLALEFSMILGTHSKTSRKWLKFGK